MKRALVLISALVILMTGMLTGCGGSKASYTEIIDVNLNQEFRIEIPANPTTGYDWQPVFDAEFLNLVKKDYIQNDHGGQQLVGSGGADLFTFRALKAGETNIKFTYYRSWETPKPDDKQQIYNIAIK